LDATASECLVVDSRVARYDSHVPF